MITIGKITDRIGYNENNELIYLGDKSEITQTELDNENGVFFDTNNINKYVTINDYNNIEETDVSFINDAKFYTCKTNGQDYLCFRCYNECQTCYSYCTMCFDCVSCNSCDNCNNCNNCNGCWGCDSCNRCTQRCVSWAGCWGCYCQCASGCRNGCQSCQPCETCNGPVGH